MKILYMDCFSGISGNMTLGAFIDLGVDKEMLLGELDKLNLDGYKIEISKKTKNGIVGTYFDVILDEEPHSHDHSHDHSNEESNAHDDKHTHSHEHRNLAAIEKIIDDSSLSQNIKNLSKKMFNYVAVAEAKIHGKPVEEVHFHEVGAIDSIIDIIGTAICVDNLNPDKIIASKLHLGSGFVRCQHGIIPVPAPATLEIIKNAKIPVYSKGVVGELVTPTGAAIVAALADEFSNQPEMEIESIGYGAGYKDFKMPNVLRLILGKKKLNPNKLF